VTAIPREAIAARDAGFRLAVRVAASRGDSALIQESINALRDDIATLAGNDQTAALQWTQFAQGAAFSVLAQLIQGARMIVDHYAAPGAYDQSLQETVAEWYDQHEGRP
jgi:predicted ATPase